MQQMARAGIEVRPQSWYTGTRSLKLLFKYDMNFSSISSYFKTNDCMKIKSKHSHYDIPLIPEQEKECSVINNSKFY